VAKVGAKAGGKFLAKAGTGAAVGSVVPGAGTAVGGAVMGAVGLVSGAMDAYEVAKAAGPLAQEVAKAWAASSNVSIIPDISVVNPDGSVKEMFDYKFNYKDGGVDRFHRGQDQIMEFGTEKYPKAVNLQSCNYCKAK
jgi:hypothetical protein